jgi:PAS domain S-box-containing protein
LRVRLPVWGRISRLFGNTLDSENKGARVLRTRTPVFLDGLPASQSADTNRTLGREEQVGAIWARRDATPGRSGTESAYAGSQGDASSLQAQLRALDLTSAGLWLLDAGGRIRWANEAAGRLIGVPPDDLLGEHVSHFIADADEALVGESRADFKVSRADGTSAWVAVTARPFLEEGNGMAGTLLTLQDIDERKRREADLRMRLATKEALVNLAELSLDAPNLKAILAESVRTVAEQLDAVLATVSWIDLERRELWVLAADGHDDDGWVAEMLDGSARPLPEPSLAASAVERSSPVVIEDFRQHPRLYPVLAERGVRSGAFVPLGDGALVLGSLSRRPGASGASAVPLITSVGRMIASYRALAGEVHRQACAGPQPGRPESSQGEMRNGHRAARRRRLPRRPV